MRDENTLYVASPSVITSDRGGGGDGKELNKLIINSVPVISAHAPMAAAR